MTPRKSPKKTSEKAVVTVDVDIITPDVFYAVQLALRDAGVIFVDTDTGNEIDGQVNFLDLGMIHPDSPRKVRRSLGFVPDKEVIYATQNLDATLHQYPEGNLAGKPVPLLIKVVAEEDVPKWLDLIAQIAPLFIIKSRGKYKPTVYFSITSLCIAGSDPEATKKAVLRKIQGYGQDDNIIIHSFGYPDFGTFDDEDDDQERM